jgi:cytochrome c
MRKFNLTGIGFGAVVIAGLSFSALRFDPAKAQGRLPSIVASVAPVRPSQTGQTLFEKRCGSCHDLKEHDDGPALGAVYNSRAGQQEGFRYSAALRTSTFVWDETNLDTWLQGPRRMVPGVRMGKTVRSPDERAVIIAYLKEVSIISKQGAR